MVPRIQAVIRSATGTVLLLALTLFVSATQTRLRAAENCPGAIDLMFVVDSSGSLDFCFCDAFLKMRSFLKNVASAFNVSPDGAHIGLVDFGSTGELVAGLSDSASALNDAIDGMPNFRGGTATDQGLKAAQAEIAAHGRNGVPQVILLLTDGNPDDPAMAEASAANSKNGGTEIFAIAVNRANDIDLTKFQEIASAPASTHVFALNDFDSLSAILQQLVVNVCAPAAVDLSISKMAIPNAVNVGSNLTYTFEIANYGPGAATGLILTDPLPAGLSFVSADATQGSCLYSNGTVNCTLGTLAPGATATVNIIATPDPMAQPAHCQAAIDVMFVVDSSGSLALCGCEAFEKIRTFSRNIVSSFAIGPANARFGLVDFSSPLDTELILPLSEDAAAINSAINSMPYFGNRTDTAGGLEKAQAELAAHGRPGLPHIIVLLTDGRANDGAAAESMAANAKASATEIFAIGATDDVNVGELQRIASAPANTHVFMVNDFDGLAAILHQLVVEVCPLAPDLAACNTARVYSHEVDPNPDDNSATACSRVLPTQLPTLHIARAGSQGVVSWPSAAVGFILEWTSTLSPFMSWSAVPGTPQLVGDEDTLGIALSSDARYYRLRKP